MDNINFNVTVASKFNKENNSIDNIMNEIDYSEDGNDVAVVMLANGTYEAEKRIKYDLFLRKVSAEGEDESSIKKYVYLFSTEFHDFSADNNRNNFVDNGTRSWYPNWFFALEGENLHINFPGRGDYELEVFTLLDEEERDPKKRYKKYREENVKPKSLYCFKVK